MVFKVFTYTREKGIGWGQKAPGPELSLETKGDDLNKEALARVHPLACAAGNVSPTCLVVGSVPIGVMEGTVDRAPLCCPPAASGVAKPSVGCVLGYLGDCRFLFPSSLLFSFSLFTVPVSTDATHI